MNAELLGQLAKNSHFKGKIAVSMNFPIAMDKK